MGFWYLGVSGALAVEFLSITCVCPWQVWFLPGSGASVTLFPAGSLIPGLAGATCAAAAGMGAAGFHF